MAWPAFPVDAFDQSRSRDALFEVPAVFGLKVDRYLVAKPARQGEEGQLSSN